jgi:hypothetical protein
VIRDEVLFARHESLKHTSAGGLRPQANRTDDRTGIARRNDPHYRHSGERPCWQSINALADAVEI